MQPEFYRGVMEVEIARLLVPLTQLMVAACLPWLASDPSPSHGRHSRSTDQQRMAWWLCFTQATVALLIFIYWE